MIGKQAGRPTFTPHQLTLCAPGIAEVLRILFDRPSSIYCRDPCPALHVVFDFTVTMQAPGGREVQACA